jgi:hypothetical protein
VELDEGGMRSALASERCSGMRLLRAAIFLAAAAPSQCNA